MTKNEIIRNLQKLSPCRIKFLNIVYHKITFDSSVYYRYSYSSSMSAFFSTPLVEVLPSLYKLRGCIRAIHLVYFDEHGQEAHLDWVAKDCVYCETLNDFINIKNIRNGKNY